MKSPILKPGIAQAWPAFSALALATLAVIVATSAQAQIYRIVGADGKISFSDQPPSTSNNVKAVPVPASSSTGPASSGLPFSLRQVATKFPVTLYTSDNCVPCGAGRSMLTSRGIPFVERTVNTSEDGEALKRLSAASSLPLLTVGSQHLKGYSDAEWTQFLDAAGYPSSSELPAAYRRPSAAPLVIVTTPIVVVPPAAAKVTKAAESPVDAAPASMPNPAGIRF